MTKKFDPSNGYQRLQLAIDAATACYWNFMLCDLFDADGNEQASHGRDAWNVSYCVAKTVLGNTSDESERNTDELATKAANAARDEWISAQP